jgi:hypothetical protein
MSDQRNPLPTPSIRRLCVTGRDQRTALDAGDLLAAMHIDHALQCLDPENPLHQQAAAQA